MADHSKWLDEDASILMASFDQAPTLRQLNNTMLEFLHAAQEKDVYFLLDFSGVPVPNGLLNLPSLLQVMNHANTRWLIIVKEESAASYMTQLLSRDKVKTFRNQDAALGFLKGMIRLDDNGDEATV